MTTDHVLPDPVDLLDRGRRLLTTAGSAASRRAARNLVPGAGQALTQTLMALCADAALDDHTAPGPATLQVLAGSCVLTVDGDLCQVQAGQWMRIPDGPHGLRAVTDVVCVLTVGFRHPDQARGEATA